MIKDDYIKKKIELYRVPIYEKGKLMGALYNSGSWIIELYDEAYQLMKNTDLYNFTKIGKTKNYDKIDCLLNWYDKKISVKMADILSYDRKVSPNSIYRKYFKTNIFGLVEFLFNMGIYFHVKYEFYKNSKLFKFIYFEIERLPEGSYPKKIDMGSLEKMSEDTNKDMFDKYGVTADEMIKARDEGRPIKLNKREMKSRKKRK